MVSYLRPFMPKDVAAGKDQNMSLDLTDFIWMYGYLDANLKPTKFLKQGNIQIIVGTGVDQKNADTFTSISMLNKASKMIIALVAAIYVVIA